MATRTLNAKIRSHSGALELPFWVHISMSPAGEVCAESAADLGNQERAIREHTSGVVSERAMAADLGWSAYFGWHVKPCTVYKTIYSK